MRSTWPRLCAVIAVLWAVSGHAADNPFLGRWSVVSADPAPWVDPQDSSTTPDVDKTISHMTITFTETGIEAPPPFGCNKVVYKLSMTEPDGLFEGGLKNPDADAAKLGFRDRKIASLNEGCASAAADFDMDFAMVDPDTLVFALNNVVYRLKRMP